MDVGIPTISMGELLAAILLIFVVAERIMSIMRVNKKIDTLCRQIGDLHARSSPTMGQEIRDLHAWHDVQDSDGVKVWYVRRSLEVAIGRLADNISHQTEIFQGMVLELKTLHTEVRQIKVKAN